MDKEIKVQIDVIIRSVQTCIDVVTDAKEQLATLRAEQGEKVGELNLEIKALIKDVPDEDLLEVMPDILMLAKAADKMAQS